MYIIYLMYEGKQVPIACETIEDDPLLVGHYLLKGVRGLKDGAYPKIAIHSLSTAKSNVNYYVMGDEVDEEPIEEEAPPPKEETVDVSPPAKVKGEAKRSRRVKSN